MDHEFSQPLLRLWVMHVVMASWGNMSVGGWRVEGEEGGGLKQSFLFKCPIKPPAPKHIKPEHALIDPPEMTLM